LHAGYKRLQTHSEYVTLIPLPVQQWLHEWASTPHYTFIASLVILPMYAHNNLPNTPLTSSTPTTTVYTLLLSPHPLHHTNKIWCRYRPDVSGFLGHCHCSMARLQAATGGTVSSMEGSCEYIE